ncbi:unnamed protein product [Oikopleura dioica]|uniref:Uncharacterized protein n=1 Tax=Oikopleura dioica TaxID=34765 RepID=E4XWI8_OIKDI|nr:unnamed protein product [Oikopleura dioica]
MSTISQTVKQKIEDHNAKKRKSQLSRQRANSFVEAPKNKCARSEIEQVPVAAAVVEFKPKIEKVKNVALPPRRFAASKIKEHSSLDRTLKDQNKLFDEINKECPSITLNKSSSSMLNAGGSKIFEIPRSTIFVDDAPKTLAKKRVNSRKLADPSQSEYLPACKNIKKGTKKRSSTTETRKVCDITKKMKTAKIGDFKSSSEDEELGLVRKPGKAEKTPVLDKKAEEKILLKKSETEKVESEKVENEDNEIEEMDTSQLIESSVGSQKRSTKKEEPVAADSLSEAFKNRNALSKPMRFLAKRKKKVEALFNDGIKNACPTFEKPEEIKFTKVFTFEECDQIISVLEDLLKLVEVEVTLPRPPSPSSESESDSETDPKKEQDTGIGSRETESLDIMDMMKNIMATLNS